MFSLINKYSKENSEKFNKDFILSRNDADILQYVTDIFKALEILNEIKVESITLETDESQFGPIKNQHKYFKSILPSRLNKIHYKLRITPTENVENFVILDDAAEKVETKTTEGSFIKEGDLYLNKLIDNCFYINEGVRYFLIYQIVDNATYGTNGCVSLKSLLMPITLKAVNTILTPELNESSYNAKYFETLLFSKRINPLLYILGKDSYNLLVQNTVDESQDQIGEWQKN